MYYMNKAIYLRIMLLIMSRVQNIFYKITIITMVALVTKCEIER